MHCHPQADEPIRLVQVGRAATGISHRTTGTHERAAPPHTTHIAVRLLAAWMRVLSQT
jgi:hypothetical protein